MHSKAGQGVGHDGAVAAQFGHLVDEFEIGAFAGGGGKAFGQFGNGRQAVEDFRALALVNRVQDFVHKTVQADKGGEGGSLSGVGQKGVRALGAKFSVYS